MKCWESIFSEQFHVFAENLAPVLREHKKFYLFLEVSARSPVFGLVEFRSVRTGVGNELAAE